MTSGSVETSQATILFTRGGWLLAVGACSAVLIAAMSPPYLPDPLRSVVVLAFHPFCHQLAERSFAIDGVPLAVCHRCLGVYAGQVAGALSLPLVRQWETVMVRQAGYVLLVALAVPGTDWLLGFTDLWENTALSRSLTGGVFGLVAGLYFARAMSHAFQPRVLHEPVPARDGAAA